MSNSLPLQPFDTVLVKPERWKEKPAFSQEEPQASPGAEAQAAIGRNRKILIVDDNPIVLKAFQMKLRACGFTVIATADASSVVNIARKEKPDVIVLDNHFDRTRGDGELIFGNLQWDGLIIMQWLERSLESVKIPIVIVTGEEPSRYKEKFLSAGATAFFQKPVNYSELLAVIRQALGDRQEPVQE